ncbi:hypothetical protein [Nocardia wallacei]|uniref:hypothetical protein n=1 Tax=Nocardia wallacei TaxID=480035 RepID=UPI002454CCCA|nr:hypothetical protein [Nocardia wallacei]
MTAAPDTDHLFLTRREIGQLTEQLHKVPALAEDLAVTETRQARIRKAGLGGPPRSGRPESQLPMHLGAFLAIERLHNELTGWVRMVCEQRAVPVPLVDDLPAASRWLARHVYALAMTPGAETALEGVSAAIAEAVLEVDLPPDDEVYIDAARLRAANGKVVTAYQVEKIAPKLGDVGHGLNRDRVRYLVKQGLRECGQDGDTKFYRLGDVLVAHMRHARRGRAGGSAA